MKTLSFWKGCCILSLKRGEDMKKVIFQDIDGVLYPCVDRKRLKIDAYLLKERLIKQDPYYKDANAKDLQAAYEGWDDEAMARLCTLVKESGACIVISSSWRFMHGLQDFKQMFHLYGLREAVIDVTPLKNGFLKEPSIMKYLEEHKDIESYVILDDLNMSSSFPDHCVVCPDVFDDACLKQAMAILTGN